MLGLLNSPYFARATRGNVADRGGCVNLGINSSRLSSITIGSIEPFRPDVVIITSGVNDLSLGDSAATLEGNYSALVSAIHGIGAVVIADEILPIGLSAGPEANRLTVNTWLHAGSSGADVVTNTLSDSRMSTFVIGDWYDVSGHPTNTNSGTDIGGGYGIKAIFCAAAVVAAMKNRTAI